MPDVDALVRLAAFEFLRAAEARFDRGEIPWNVLIGGFMFEGQRVPLVSMQGIFKPAILRDAPLSIRTAARAPGDPRPYDDEVGDDGTISYCYRAGASGERDNELLRNAFRKRLPLVYFFGIEEGIYTASFPAFVVADEVSARRVLVQFDAAVSQRSTASSSHDPWFDDTAGSELRRRYVTVQALRRVHQHAFRRQVLRAYRRRCSICSLKREELLDAAHIIPDCEPAGTPVIPNGLSMCHLHHKAFDSNLIAIRPDLRVVVRPDVLDEEDGPMLLHGLKGFHDQPIDVPRRSELQPDRDRLDRRFERFRKVAGL